VAFPKPCVVCGLPTLESRCQEHRLPDRRPSTARRGNRTEIDKRRRQCLARDNFTCLHCGLYDRSGKSLHADHIVESVDGGSNGLENLQTLCVRCHLVKTQRERMRRQ